MKIRDEELVQRVLQDSENLDRLSKDTLYFRYYQGDHDILYDQERKDRNRIVFNHCLRIIETSVAIIKGLPMRVIAEPETLEALDLDDAKATSIIRDGSIFGNAFALVWFDTATSKFRYTELLDMESFPLYSPDSDQMEAFIRYYAVRPRPGENELTEIGKAWIYRADSITYLERQGVRDFKIIWQKPNPIGEIPVVHFRNRRIGGELFGHSDLEGIKSLQDDYNKQCSNESDILDYHGYPQLVGKNLESVEKIKRGVDQIINIVGYETSDLKYLSRQLPTQAFKEKLEREKTAIHYLTSTPEIDKNLLYGNISGITIQMLYRDALIKARVKGIEYAKGFTELFKLIIRATNRILGKNLSDRVEVSFQYNTPENEYERASLVLQFYKAGLLSFRRAMELNPYVSNVEEEIREIERERGREKQNE